MNDSGNVLAFIGDAVLSLQVREYMVELGQTRLKTMQETSIKFVSAKAQAEFMNFLLSNDEISENEMIYYKRGRNAKSRSMAKNADMLEYRIATGFEALWGYLHLDDQRERLDELWLMFKERVEL